MYDILEWKNSLIIQPKIKANFYIKSKWIKSYFLFILNINYNFIQKDKFYDKLLLFTSFNRLIVSLLLFYIYNY